jgi:hypothetical protein
MRGAEVVEEVVVVVDVDVGDHCWLSCCGMLMDCE